VLSALALALGTLALLAAGARAAAPSTGTHSSGTTPGTISTTGSTTNPVGFGRPFQIIAPTDSDLLPAVLGYADSGTAAAAFGTYDEDEPGISAASLATQAAANPFTRPAKISNAQQVLSLTYLGTDLELLVGTSPHKIEFGTLEPCCSKEVIVRVPKGAGFKDRHTLIEGLDGASQGTIVPADGRLLAAAADEEGVWAAQSNTNGRFGRTHALAPAGSFTQTMDAAGLSNGRTIVVWTARTSQFAPGPIAIYDAVGTPNSGPSKAAIAINVPASHEIDELAVAAHGAIPTVAWIESWYDGAGAFHSQAFAEDLAGAHRAQPVSSPTVLASGLALGSGANGDEVIAFRACTLADTCTVEAATRRAGHFAAAASLGAIEASQKPVVAESPTGYAMVGWVNPLGNVNAAIAPAATGHFAGAYRVSKSGYASDLTAAFAPTGNTATVAWTQGTYEESLVGATYTSPAAARAVITPPKAPKKKKKAQSKGTRTSKSTPTSTTTR
jgi:hypothetical protein